MRYYLFSQWALTPPQQSPHRAPSRPFTTCTAHSATWIKPMTSSTENRDTCQDTTPAGSKQVDQEVLLDR